MTIELAASIAGAVVTVLLVGYFLIGIGRSLESLAASKRVEEFRQEYLDLAARSNERVADWEKVAEGWEKTAHAWRQMYEQAKAERREEANS